MNAAALPAVTVRNIQHCEFRQQLVLPGFQTKKMCGHATRLRCAVCLRPICYEHQVDHLQERHANGGEARP